MAVDVERDDECLHPVMQICTSGGPDAPGRATRVQSAYFQHFRTFWRHMLDSLQAHNQHTILHSRYTLLNIFKRNGEGLEAPSQNLHYCKICTSGSDIVFTGCCRLAKGDIMYIHSYHESFVLIVAITPMVASRPDYYNGFLIAALQRHRSQDTLPLVKRS